VVPKRCGIKLVEVIICKGIGTFLVVVHRAVPAYGFQRATILVGIATKRLRTGIVGCTGIIVVVVMHGLAKHIGRKAVGAIVARIIGRVGIVDGFKGTGNGVHKVNTLNVI